MVIVLLSLAVAVRCVYRVSMTFDSVVPENQHVMMSFVNHNKTNLFNKIDIRVQSKVHDNQYVNIYTLESEEDAKCYSTYFSNPYMICSSYFTHSFDSFIRQDSNVSLCDSSNVLMSDTYFVIFDNSLSKREMIDESDRAVKLTHSVAFRMDDFDDYHHHVQNMYVLLAVLAAGLLLLLGFQLFEYRSIEKKLSKDDKHNDGGFD